MRTADDKLTISCLLDLPDLLVSHKQKKTNKKFINVQCVYHQFSVNSLIAKMKQKFVIIRLIFV